MPLYTPTATLAGFKNKFINGDQRIDIVHNGASQTITAAAALAYTVDQWYAYCTGANVTGQRVAGTTDSQFRYQFTGAASVTAINYGSRIEAANSYELNGTTATLSVDTSNSLLTTMTWELYYANTTDTFGTIASPTVTSIASGSFTISSSVARYSVQVAIPSAAITGLQVRLSVGAQTSGTWLVGNVQLEAGASATTFEKRPIEFEREQCSRYLPAFRVAAANEPLLMTASAATTGAISGHFLFPIPTRVAVTGVTISAASDFRLSRPSTGLITPASISFGAGGMWGANLQWNVTGAVTDQVYYLTTGGAALIYFTGAQL